MSSMPRFSLIVATRDRTSELSRFIASLRSNSLQDFELIVVDQNDDDRLGSILADALPFDQLRVIRCPIGVSRARNAGLDAARGEILAFPDDDCWYPNDILQSVSTWFESHPAKGMLSVGTVGTRVRFPSAQQMFSGPRSAIASSSSVR
jgi:glycosyltransferase involved in cell wall biosynthesis